MRLLAPGKINLHLRVGAVESSGFHPLASWFVTIGLFDTILCEPTDDRQIAISCDDPAIPTDERNLVVRVAQLLQRENAPDASVPEAKRGARFQLQKRIPAGGGLGGGSSDAARTIVALSHLWKLEMSFPRMGEIAAQMGSDVPFFLHGRSCVCAGRGERVRPIAPPRPRWALLILPDIAIATVAVYGKFDSLGLGRSQDLNREPDWQEWSTLDALALLPRLKNDLELAAFEMNEPLRRLRSETEQSLGRIVRMSGSGSTLFSLFDDESEAMQAKGNLSVRSVVVPIVPTILDDLAIV
jgi:4-diphosphocytidyl-2-C-methyl-D-erythritol kinase